MDNNVELADLKSIIHELISFIVVEGKQYVDKDQQDAYVKHYVQCIAQAIHEAPLKKKNLKILDIMQFIAKDIGTIGEKNSSS